MYTFTLTETPREAMQEAQKVLETLTAFLSIHPDHIDIPLGDFPRVAEERRQAMFSKMRKSGFSSSN